MRYYQDERGKKESITITSLPSHEPLLFWRTRHLGFPTEGSSSARGHRSAELPGRGGAVVSLKCPSNYGGRPRLACLREERRSERLPGHPSAGRGRREQGRSSSSRAGMRSSAATPLPCAGAITFRGQRCCGEGHKYSTARGAWPRGRACVAGLTAGVRAHPAIARTCTAPAHGRDF